MLIKNEANAICTFTEIFIMMTIQAGDATLIYDNDDKTLKLKGSMRLANMQEYDQITVFLKEIASTNPGHFTLDFSELQFLNSSGITTISLFILACRKNNDPTLTVLGSKEISWQQKSLSNFKKLWNNVSLQWVEEHN